MAPLYADVRAYCSHVKTYCKRARLLSSHPQLFILSLFDLAHHIFGETFRTFEVSILSVNRGKLDIRYLVGPYVALHSTSTNPCALDNHAFQKMLFSQTVFNSDSPEETPSILFSYSISTYSSVIATATLSLSPRLDFFSSHCLACKYFLNNSNSLSLMILV